jgi:hypothetical protein
MSFLLAPGINSCCSGHIFINDTLFRHTRCVSHESKRAHILLPEDLVKEIDSIVGPRILRLRNKRREWLAQLVRDGHTLSTTTLNVAELYAGMRPG